MFKIKHWLMGLLLGAVILLAVVFLFRGVLIAPLLEDFLVSTLESELGLAVSIERIGGSYLASLEITGVRTEEPGTGPLRTLDLERLRLEYSLLSLLKGTGAFLAGMNMDLHRARVEIDLDRGEEEEGADDSSGGDLSLPPLPRGNIRETSLFINRKDYRLEFADLFLEHRPGTVPLKEGSMDIRAGNMRILHPNLRDETVSLSAGLEYGEGSVTVRELTLDGLPVMESARIDLGGFPENVSFDSTLFLFEGHLDLAGKKSGQEIDLLWKGDGLDLGRFTSLILIPGLDLDGLLSSEGKLLFDTDNLAGMEGGLTFEWTDGSVRGTSIDSLLLRASAGGGTLRVADLDGRLGPNAIHLEEASAPLEALLALDTDRLPREAAGSFYLDLSDIPALLAAAGIRGKALESPVPGHHLLLEGTAGGGSFSLTSGTLDTETGSIILEGGKLNLPEPGRPWGETTMTAALFVELPDLGELSTLFPLPLLQGSLEGRFDLDGSFGSPKGSADVEARSIVVEGRAIGDGTLRAVADPEKISIDLLTITHGEEGANEVTLEAFTVPMKILHPFDRDRLLPGLSGNISLKLTDLPALFDLAGMETSGVGENIPGHLLALEGGLENRIFSVSSGKLETEGGAARLERGEVTLPGPGEGWGTAAVSTSLTVDLPDLGPLSDLFPLPALEGSLQGRFDLDGSLGSPEGSADMEARGIVVEGRAIGDGTLKAGANPERVSIDLLTVTQGEAGANELTLEGFTVPMKTLHPFDRDRLLSSLSGSISLKLSDLPALFDLAGMEMPGNRENTPAHHLVLEGSLEKGMILISSGQLETEGGAARLDRGEVILPGTGEGWGTAAVSTSLTVDLPDLGALSDLFPLPAMEGSLGGRVDLEGTISDPRGSVSAAGADISIEGLALGEINLEAEADSRKVTIHSLEARSGDDRISGKGSLEIDSRRMEDVFLDFHLDDIAGYTDVLLSEEWDLGGSLRGKIEAGGEISEPDAKADIHLSGGHYGELEISEAAFQGTASGREVMISRAQATTSQGRIAFSGQLSAGPGFDLLELLLDDFSLAREGVDLSLRQPSRITYSTEGRYSVENFVLEGSVGRIGIDGEIIPEGVSELDVQVSELTGEGWLEDLTGDRFHFSGADLDARFSGSTDHPEISVKGTVEEFGSRAVPTRLEGRFDLEYSPGRILIRDLEWSTPDGHRSLLTGELPLDPLSEELFQPGEISLQGQVDISDLKGLGFLMPPDLTFGGALKGVFRLAGTWDHPLGELNLEGQDLTLPPSLKSTPPGPLSVTGGIALSTAELVLENLRIESPDLEVSGSGTWSRTFSLIQAIRGETLLLTGDISLGARFSSPDISWAATGIEDIRRLRGKADGEISLEGDITRPRVEASVTIQEGELRYGGSLPLLTGVNLKADLDDESLRLEEVTGELGGAPFSLSGSIARGGEEGPRMDLQFQGENVLLFRDEGIRLRADTGLEAVGPLNRLKVSGDLDITHSHFIRNFDFLSSFGDSSTPQAEGKTGLFSFRDPPLKDMVFEIKIGTKDPFLIRSNLARGSVRPDLLLTGTGEIPVMVGKVFIDPTRITLPLGSLNLESGIIAFLPGDPDRPVLELLGRSRLMGYDITVVVGGPLDEPRVILSSVPDLPNAEILLLLLTGTPPSTTDTGSRTSAAGANLAVFLSRGFLSRFFGSDESVDSLTERFEMEVGREVTERGHPTIDTSFRMVDNFFWRDGTLYLTSQKDVYDEYNYGVRFVVQFE